MTPHPKATLRSPSSERYVGGFLFWDRLAALPLDDRRRLFDDFAKAGLNLVVTESEEYETQIIDDARAAGLQFWGGLGCFTWQTREGNVLERRPHLWPILATGRRRPQMEWYNGVIPTDPAYNDARIDLASDLVSEFEFDGFALDFVRWPMHWELELRPGRPAPLENSFDPQSVQRFRDWADVDIPTDAIASEIASIIYDRYPGQWIDFKCEVITAFVERMSARLRASSRRPISIALCTVPEHPEWVGQRLGDLAGVVDIVCPMSYHPILHRQPSWVIDTVRQAVSSAPGQVAPILQIDTDGEEFGADFGAPVSDEDFESILADTLEEEVAGVLLFTGTDLARPSRLQTLSRVLATRSTTGAR
jgi:hypothetical protein